MASHFTPEPRKPRKITLQTMLRKASNPSKEIARQVPVGIGRIPAYSIEGRDEKWACGWIFRAQVSIRDGNYEGKHHMFSDKLSITQHKQDRSVLQCDGCTKPNLS